MMTRNDVIEVNLIFILCQSLAKQDQSRVSEIKFRLGDNFGGLDALLELEEEVFFAIVGKDAVSIKLLTFIRKRVQKKLQSFLRENDSGERIREHLQGAKKNFPLRC